MRAGCCEFISGRRPLVAIPQPVSHLWCSYFLHSVFTCKQSHFFCHISIEHNLEKTVVRNCFVRDLFKEVKRSGIILIVLLVTCCMSFCNYKSKAFEQNKRFFKVQNAIKITICIHWTLVRAQPSFETKLALSQQPCRGKGLGNNPHGLKMAKMHSYPNKFSSCKEDRARRVLDRAGTLVSLPRVTSLWPVVT